MADGVDTNEPQFVGGSCVLEQASDIDAWLRGAFEQSSGGIFVMAPDGRTLLFNAAMAAVTGWPLGEVCCEPWLASLFSADDLRATGDQVARALREPSVAQLETQIVRRDGQRAWVSLALQPLRTPERTLVLGTVFDISDRKRLETERARVNASLEQAYRDLAVVQDLSELAMATLDLRELFDTVLKRVVETTGAERAVVLLREGDRLISRAAVGLEAQVREGFGMGIGEGFAGIIAHTGEPLYLADARVDPRVISPFIRREGVVSMYGVPILRRGGELIGVLLVGWLETHTPDDRELRLLEIVANRVGSAIYNAVLYSQTVRERTLSQAQNRLNAEVSGTLDVDEVLRRVTRETCEVTGAAGSLAALVEGGELVVRHVAGATQELLGYRMSAEVTQSLASTDLAEGVLRVRDVAEGGANEEAARQFGIRAFLGAPLKARDEFLGALLLTWPDPVREFNDLDVDFLARVAASVSLAVQNARLYSAQLGIARTLQEALLAEPEVIPELRIAHLYRSATAQADVGGDFYDVFRVGERVGVLIGDVSGKGVGAATLTALCKSVARAFALEGDGPAEILRKANNLILAASPGNVFVTMFLGLLDLDTGRLTYCSAGHPPPLVRRVGAAPAIIEQLSGVCPLLGAMRDMRYDNHHGSLRPGDVLLMFTDGVLEARNAAGEFFDGERVTRYLMDVRHGTVSSLPTGLYEAVLKFTGGKLADDLAILALERRE